MHWCTQPANINVSIRSFVRLTQDVLSYTNKIAGVVENGYAAVPFFVVETDAQAVQAVEPQLADDAMVYAVRAPSAWRKFRNANHSSVAANTSRIRYFFALGPYVVSLNAQFP